LFLGLEKFEINEIIIKKTSVPHPGKTEDTRNKTQRLNKHSQSFQGNMHKSCGDTAENMCFHTPRLKVH
jgi:hypothetical protein